MNTRISAALTAAIAFLTFTQTAPAAESDPVRAQIRSRHLTQLSAGLNAKIEKLPFREGEFFKKGEDIVVYDCRLEQAQLRYARAEARAARKEAASVESLNRLQGASVIELENARAKVELADAKVKIEEVRLQTCKEPAPFAGAVVKRYVNEEQRIKLGDPIMDIEDPTTLELEMRIPSSWLSRVKEGDTFRMRVDDTGAVISGKIMRLGTQVDAVSRTVPLYGELSSPDHTILPGMSGDVVFDFH